MVGVDEREVRPRRGRLIAYVPQDPATALNPSMRIKTQMLEVLRAHGLDQDADTRIPRILDSVNLPGGRTFLRRFPHQLSGGQQQRVAIAIALACGAAVIVLDEPTTGLDVVTQARILEEIERLKRETDVALVYVSHDLSVVSQAANRIAVMYAGRIVEHGPTRAIIGAASHPYAVGLISSVPDHVVPRRLVGIAGVAVGIHDRPPGCAFAPRCALRIPECDARVPALERIGSDHFARCIRWRDTAPPTVQARLVDAAPIPQSALLSIEGVEAEYRGARGKVQVVKGVTFDVSPGLCVALVGESGSGKTTIARCIVGLHAPSSGRILLRGRELAPFARSRSREDRRTIQIVFQNPYDSLNPRRSVEDAVAWPARAMRGMSRKEAEVEASNLLQQVRLSARIAQRFPGELSGGERQRVAIARALAAGPSLLVCDEIVSSLDVSVQAAVLDLLAELRQSLELGVLFISHDLGVVASIAEQVVVLDEGAACERGPVRSVLAAPQADYTARLIAAAPTLIDVQGSNGRNHAATPTSAPATQSGPRGLA